jgi:hypothetical protein
MRLELPRRKKKAPVCAVETGAWLDAEIQPSPTSIEGIPHQKLIL